MRTDFCRQLSYSRRSIDNEELGFNAVPFYVSSAYVLDAVRSTGLRTGNLYSNHK